MDELTIRELRSSSIKLGKFYPILQDREGNIIDGQHRIAADASWPRMTLEGLSEESDRIVAKLVINTCRRIVTTKEKTRLLNDLGAIYARRGIPLGLIARKIAEETGMSYNWVMKYLPAKYKQRPGVGGPKCSRYFLNSLRKFDKNPVTRRVTLDLSRLHFSNGKTPVIAIKVYRNASFVDIVIDKEIFEKLRTVSDNIGMDISTFIGNVFLELVEKCKATDQILCV